MAKTEMTKTIEQAIRDMDYKHYIDQLEAARNQQSPIWE